ncbi:long-chain fatty acid transport protein 2-like [Ruditapes philippinarum]|uniref:long-chain fatty acid transport protein 2-like n=1 Tax=Ruditapes philippinarum TaxID=129788 RepID=UPI00295C34AD|nr:long-chain fatty acid transport protein 2-like [Ruditapes philippinarum]
MWWEVLWLIPAAFATVYVGIKLSCPWLILDVHYISKVVPSLAGFKKACRKKYFIIDHFENSVKQCPDRIFLSYEDQTFTYQEANKQAYIITRTLMGLGLKKGDTVAFIQYNGPEFIWMILGCLKAGICVSLINTNLRGKALLHCLNVSGTNTIVTGSDTELTSAVDDLLCDLPDAVVYVQGPFNKKLSSRFISLHFNESEADMLDIDPIMRSEQKESDSAVFVFTSGTTGLPKAATVSHKRMLAPYILSGILKLRQDDTVYVTLPLYHSNGLFVGVCSAICHGSSIAIAKKFSKSGFWNDVRRHKVTVFTFIGEMCRFLLTNEKSDQDKDHSVRLAIGNGLRQDIFAEFKERFGIPTIAEFYASTEGVAGFANVSNVIGSCGRSSPLLEKVVPCGLFKWDVENQCIVRDERGHCIPVKLGEPGLLLMQINSDQPFDGYKGQKQQSETKVVRNVRKDGDLYFNTGDLMTKDKDYNVYFNDRIGDTFRWKSENVSTTEVSNHLTDIDFIIDACVYGVNVPGHDGKAGMATLLIKPEVTVITEKELSVISTHCQQSLPVYAIPMFLRLKWGELDMTSTIKQSKVKLKEEGFNIEKVTDILYYYEKPSKTYKQINKDVFKDISTNKIPF